ncbi:MAG: TonB-dependent receptor [Bacteroides sp.]|nr:TonB-dependent receptor [Bacteroides sp.]
MNMNKLTCILIGLLIGYSSLSAQTSLSGLVLDENKLPLENVSVVVQTSTDSSFVAGTTTDINGAFLLTNVASGKYVLSFSMIGYKRECISKSVDKQLEIRLNAIILQEDAHLLSAITITGKKPPFKMEAGKTTIDLSSALLSTDGNILDALKKLPGIIVQNDGTIILNGQTGAKVLMDDKLTYLSGDALISFLQSLPASSVDKIELISQPSSQYDATGNSGFINIQRKKVTTQGIRLSASSGIQLGKHTRGSENLSLSIRHNRLSIYMDYSLYWGTDFGDVISSRNYLDPVTFEPTQLRLDMDAHRKTRYQSHYAKAGADYDLSSRLTLGGYIASNWLDRKKDEVCISDFYTGQAQKDSTLTAISRYNVHHTNLMGGANVLYKWQDNSKWDAAFDFQHFRQENDMIQGSVFQIPPAFSEKDSLAGNTNGDIRLYSGQTNLSHHFSDRFKISTGLKSTFVKISNEAIYQNKQEEAWQKDDKLSSHFRYDEDIQAGYFQVSSQWSSSFSIEIGVRAENTQTKSFFSSHNGDSTVRQNYIHLFPAFMAQYQPSEKHGFSFIYNRRIIRPNYRDLNPFVEVSDRYLHDRGNVELKPELIDNFEISWLLKKQYAIRLFYSRRKNPITKSYVVEENSTIIVMPLNLDKNHSAGIKLGLNNLKPFNWWTMHVNSSLTYKQFNWMMADELYKESQVTPMIHVSNQLSLPHGWGIEAVGFYNGKMVEGQATIHSFWTVSVGARKSLLNNRLSLYIYGNDIFFSNHPTIDLQSNYLSGWYKDSFDTRMVGITLTYRFNSGKGIKDSRRENRIDESKRINL